MPSEKSWNQPYVAYFRGGAAPLEVKLEIEKTTGILLTRDPETTSKLVFKGTSSPPPTGHNLELRLEAVSPKETWYSLHDDMWLACSWSSEAEFRSTADRTFQYWTRNLKATSSLGSPEAALTKLYKQRMRETLEREAEAANRKEDEGPIRTVQQAVLAALRKGGRFATAHHEGGTRLYFNGSKFVREDYGLEEALTVYPTDEEMLLCLRNFYDWESRKGSYPHKPPELEVWKFIQRQLM